MGMAGSQGSELVLLQIFFFFFLSFECLHFIYYAQKMYSLVCDLLMKGGRGAHDGDRHIKLCLEKEIGFNADTIVSMMLVWQRLS